MKQHFGHHMPVGTQFKVPIPITICHILLQNKDGITFVPSFKYTLDLFYILPFYHIEVLLYKEYNINSKIQFPVGLQRLMVLDADIEVYCDLRKLWQHFQHFSSTQVEIFKNSIPTTHHV